MRIQGTSGVRRVRKISPRRRRPGIGPAQRTLASGSLRRSRRRNRGADMVTLIQNAAIVGTRDGSITRNMSIVLQGDSIQTIAPASTVHVDASAQVVDVSGKYVVPGFLDMHAHAVDAPLSEFAMLLANGVTGIRQMSGSPDLIQRARALNDGYLGGSPGWTRGVGHAKRHLRWYTGPDRGRSRAICATEKGRQSGFHQDRGGLARRFPFGARGSPSSGSSIGRAPGADGDRSRSLRRWIPFRAPRSWTGASARVHTGRGRLSVRG